MNLRVAMFKARAKRSSGTPCSVLLIPDTVLLPEQFPLHFALTILEL